MQTLDFSFLGFRQDRDLRYLEAIFGSDGAGSATGKTDADVFPSSLAEQLTRRKRRALDEGTPLRERFTVGQDAEARTYVIEAQPERDDAGQILGLRGVLILDRGPDPPPAEIAQDDPHWGAVRHFFDALPQFVAYVGRDQRIRFANRVCREEFGLQEGASLEPSLRLVLGEQATGRFMTHLARVLSGRVLEYQDVVRDALGRTRNLEGMVVPDRGADGSVLGAYAMFTDVTASARMAEARRAGEQRFRELVEAMNEGLAIEDNQGVVTYVNRRFREILGCRRSDLVGRSILDFLDEPNRLSLSGQLDRTDQEQQDSCEVELTRMDGAKVHSLMSTKPLHDRAGERVGRIVVAMDISEHKRLREQFRQAAKMEAVGRLAGGVAHDFNNQLTVIQGFADLVLSDLPAEGSLRSSIHEIRKAAERAQEVTSQLLAFSRQQPLRPETVHPGNTLTDLRSPLSRLIGESISLSIEPGRGTGYIRVDRARLGQAIVNLVVNSRDAMPGGGRITIAASNEDIRPVHANRFPGIRPGPYVHLAITDTGQGMSEETRQRVFEPFFTTKAMGEGTGLGLSMVYGFVKQSDGFVYIESELGRGTSVRIFLPRLDVGEAAQTPPADETAPDGGSETLLVVEDDPSVRKFVRQVLRGAGYTVLAATDAADALRLEQVHTGRIDLLVTDVVMPGMRGPELAKFLRGLRPELKVLYISGYTDNAVVDDSALVPGENFLTKPFASAKLARLVRKLLDQAEHAE